MNFGVYIHIPYCLQRCTYCDFATYEHTKILPPDEYVEAVKSEIRMNANSHNPRSLDTLYFGGGTPSLIKPQLIVSLIEELAKYGFKLKSNAECTIEINPATISEESLKVYLDSGINRFSVGAQSFNDRLLKSVHREHNAQQTRQTLDLLSKYKVNYTFDLLFALPHQTIEELAYDLEIVKQYNPPHLSAYCLTVPETHPLAKNRPLEEDQILMFDLIESELRSIGIHKYEISNFAKDGFESRHNNLYWTYGDEYWGLGLSAHSYTAAKPWGARYWNANNIDKYIQYISANKNKKSRTPFDLLPEDQYEVLNQNKALTDFCHISLRTRKGISQAQLTHVFSEKIFLDVKNILDGLIQKNLILTKNDHYILTEKGQLISNSVFESLTFMDD